MFRVEDTFWIRGWKTERGGENEWSEGGKKSSLFHPWGGNTGAKARRIGIEQGRKLKVPHVVSFDFHAYNLFSALSQRLQNYKLNNLGFGGTIFIL